MCGNHFSVPCLPVLVIGPTQNAPLWYLLFSQWWELGLREAPFCWRSKLVQMDLGQEPRAVATLTFGEVLTQGLTKQPQGSKEGICSQEASQSQGWAFAGSAIALEAEETEKG